MMSMNIFEIDRRMEFLVDPETGEIGDYDLLMTLFEERDAALENLALMIKNETAMVEALAAEKKSLDARKREHEKKLERLTWLLDNALEDDTGFETGKVKVSTRRVSSVEIQDEDKVFQWLDTHRNVWKDRLTPLVVEKREISKRVLGLMLLDHTIPGAERVTKRSVSVK